MNASRSDATDRQLGSLRIVICGLAMAGKTTTIRTLADRLGQAVTSHRSVDGSTSFEWMEYEGGRHEGRPIETQLIALGSDTRPEIAAHIVGLAHSVLFVVDSSAEVDPATSTLFATVRSILGAGGNPSARLVVQANKRDADELVEIDELRTMLELDDAHTVVETVATAGDGLRQAFVFAVRGGLEELGSQQPRHADQAAGGLSIGSPEDLLASLPEPEQEALVELATSAAQIATHAGGSASGAAPSAGGPGFAVVDRDAPASDRPAAEPARLPSRRREDRRTVSAEPTAAEATTVTAEPIAAEARQAVTEPAETHPAATVPPALLPPDTATPLPVGVETSDLAPPPEHRASDRQDDDGPPPPGADAIRSHHQPPPPDRRSDRSEEATTMLEKVKQFISGA